MTIWRRGDAMVCREPKKKERQKQINAQNYCSRLGVNDKISLVRMGVGAQNSLGGRNHLCPKNFATTTKPDA